MLGLRFLDPETGEIVYPDPLDTTGDPITSGLETPNPPTGSPALNPMLAPGALPWDVRRSFPTHARDWRQLEINKLAEPATSPPMARLEIRSPQLPWNIEVRPTIPNLYVTVYDVLATLNKALETQITKGEWGQFNDQRKYAILVARIHRVQQHDFSRGLDDLYRHPRRVDSLGERTQFAGLAPAPYRGSDSFDLKFVRWG